MFTGDLQASFVDYISANLDKKLFPPGDWYENKKYIVIGHREFANDQELNKVILKAQEAINFVNHGNNGKRFDYDICVTNKCWGANSNTVFSLVAKTIDLDYKVPKGVKLPGIKGRFYNGLFDFGKPRNIKNKKR